MLSAVAATEHEGSTVALTALAAGLCESGPRGPHSATNMSLPPALQGLSRAALLEPVKANARDLDAWALLIRFDAVAAAAKSAAAAQPDAAAAAAAQTAALDAWRAVDRLSGQAYLANKDSVKQRPLAYISVTLDQARAQLRIAGAATAKKVLRGVASLPEVKSSWPFYRALVLLEALQGASWAHCNDRGPSRRSHFHPLFPHPPARSIRRHNRAAPRVGHVSRAHGHCA